MSPSEETRRSQRRTRVALATTTGLLILACAADRGLREAQHGWMGERGIVVPHDSFPADCTLCHTGDDWSTLRADFSFDHLAETGVPLEGAHAEAQCLRCHNDRGPVAVYAARGCAGCHDDVHQGTLGPRCTDCHDESSWLAPPEIVAHQRTRFPLFGAHLATPCWRCHPGSEVGNYQRVDVECITCHAPDLARAQDPDHVAQGWVDDCDRCHVPTSWTGAGFNHSFFPLTGAHAAADCTACHVDGQFTGLPTSCVGCHQADYDGTEDPDHVANQFPTSCELCHDTSSWEGAMFSHAGISSGCVECHLEDYQRTTDPDHAAAGLPTTCEQCHATNTWDGAMFDHSGVTMGCVQCHLDDYQGTTDPNHQQAGIPTTCEQCHDTDSWDGAEFDHVGVRNGCVECHLDDYQQTTDPNHMANGYPTSCEQCHQTTDWRGVSFDHAGVRSGCVQCHLPDYQGTTDPNHAAAGFPTACEACHTTRGWEPANFRHGFPIDRGAHSSISCGECHPNPRAPRVFTCTDCHAHQQGETNEDHSRVPGYVYESLACYQCHPNGD